jgi:hypothetical protein
MGITPIAGWFSLFHGKSENLNDFKCMIWGYPYFRKDPYNHSLMGYIVISQLMGVSRHGDIHL